MGDASQWEKVGRQIFAERSRRWHKRAEFAEATNLHVRTIDKIENGRQTNFRPETLARIEIALHWAPGAILDLVDGQPLRREFDSDLRRIYDAWEYVPQDVRQALADMAARYQR